MILIRHTAAAAFTEVDSVADRVVYNYSTITVLCQHGISKQCYLASGNGLDIIYTLYFFT